MNKKNSIDTKINNNKISIICLLVLIVVFLEIFLFNFRFFQTLGYEPVTLNDAAFDKAVNSLGNSTFRFNDDNTKIKFENINTEVKNIYIDMENTKTLPLNPRPEDIKENESNKLVKVKITIDDFGKSNGIDMPERSIVSTVENTKYIPLNLKGESNTLIIELKNVKGKEIRINNIILNANVPFHFSILRVLIILICIGLFYIIKPGSKFYSYKLNLKRKKQKIFIPIIITLQIILMIAASHINPMYVYNTVSWQSQYGDIE